jgi:hypothetical protein
MMNNLNVILPQADFYWVGTLTDSGLDALKVTQELQCACGGTAVKPCAHIRAVQCYRRLHGDEESSPPEPLGECPICGSPVVGTPDRWRCTASAGHYWQHRGEQGGVKAFLTRPHPAKQGAFYEQSIEEREAFLEQAHRRLYANGHTPYG